MNTVSNQASREHNEAGLAPLRVLLLDDDVFMLDVLSDML